MVKCRKKKSYQNKVTPMVLIINIQKQLLFPSWSKSKWKPLTNQTWSKSISSYVDRINANLEDFRYTRKPNPDYKKVVWTKPPINKSYILGSKTYYHNDIRQWKNKMIHEKTVLAEIYLFSNNSGIVTTPDKYAENHTYNHQELFAANI